MATNYILQFSANSNYCLGVTTTSPGSLVVLSLIQGTGSPLTQWNIDPNSGFITLAGSPDPNNPLYLDFQGTSPANGNAIIINPLALGRNFQRWNWLGNQPFVMNVGAPTFCIDNMNGSPTPGNKIQIWSQLPGDTNQMWQFLAVPVLESALAASAR